MMLKAVAITRKEANDFVANNHRHHKPCTGDKFRVAVCRNGCSEILGIAQVGRPVARCLDDGKTVEVLRLAVSEKAVNTKNACSFLYARCCEAAKALGYERIVTYTLASESGTSCRAAGFHLDGKVRGREWSCKSRPRSTTSPTCDKIRWVKYLSGEKGGNQT